MLENSRPFLTPETERGGSGTETATLREQQGRDLKILGSRPSPQL